MRSPLTPSGHALGWRRQLLDPRDQHYAAPAPVLRQLPKMVDLRHSGFEPPIYDQGQTSSCTGNGVAALVQYDLAKQGAPPVVPSRLFAYYNGRYLDHTQGQDCGANIRDVIKGVASWGVCPETVWPFDPARVTARPHDAAYAAAKRERALTYRAVPQSLNQLKGCLADGYPFTFGFMVYPEMDSADVAAHGRLPVPRTANEASLGGHCVDAFGYNDEDGDWGRVFLCRNSWGAAWGLKGHFLMPYEYILDPQLSSDFWMIQTVG